MGSQRSYICCPSCPKGAILVHIHRENPILANGPMALLFNNLKSSSGASAWAEPRQVWRGASKDWEGARSR